LLRDKKSCRCLCAFSCFFWKLKLCKQNEVVPALWEPLASIAFTSNPFLEVFELLITFSLPGMMADCIADLLCTNNCFSPNMFFLIEMNDVFSKFKTTAVPFPNVDIGQNRGDRTGGCGIIKTLVKIH
jgi:hypothetical protein